MMSKELEDSLGLRIQGLHRAEQGGLLVQRFASPGNERRGNAERRAIGVLQDIRRAGHVPGGVSAGFERRADAA